MGAVNRITEKFRLKVYSNELFFISTNERLCKSFTKLVIILFLSEAVFIKKNYFNILC